MAIRIDRKSNHEQTNSYGKGFEFRAALTDMDHVERNRILQCIAMRNKK